MAKKDQVDFQKVWEDAKEEALRLSKDIGLWVKKGEKEIVKLSGQAKVNYEIMRLKVNKEQLLHSIGKGYYASQIGKKTSIKLDKLVDNIKKIDKQISVNKRLLKKKK